MQLTFAAAAVTLSALALGLGYTSADPQPAVPGNPLLSLQRPASDARLRGVVEQRLWAGSYTYLAVRTEQRALRWAVTMGHGEPEGARVSVRSLGQRADFYSPRLRRHFPDLVFGLVSRDEGGAQ
jgi:hypothetical protein